MRVSSLRLRNYRRFKELDLEFPDGVVGILGPNGAGKSTVIESIAWALFGNIEEATRTDKESIKRVGAAVDEPCSVTLDFELNGVEYRIEREMRGKNLTAKATLKTKEAVLANSEKDATAKVEKLIGMDYKSFFTSVFARQKDLSALQDAQPGDRRKTVLKMLRIDAVDEVLQLVRDDRRDVSKRIEWAQKQLQDEDGRDKEEVIKAGMPALEAASEEATKRLKAASEKEQKASADAEEARKQRDDLRKDYEGYNQALSELTAKRAALTASKERMARTSKRIGEVEDRLKRMPELEKADSAWKEIVAKKERLETEKLKAEKAAHLRKDIADLTREHDTTQKELEGSRGAAKAAAGLEEELKEADRQREESVAERTRLSARIGELKAGASERRSAAAKDRKKLEEISAAGRDGVCPTCERALGDAYALLIEKLRRRCQRWKEAAAREKEAADAELAVGSALKREEALAKRRAAKERELTLVRRTEAAASEKEKNLARLSERMKSKAGELAAIGETRFSDEEHAVTKAEHDRLRPLHDEYIRLKGTEEELARLRRDLADAKEQSERVGREEGVVAGMVAVLEPKKAQYDVAYKQLDHKTAELNTAKDERHKAATAKEKSEHGLTQARQEIERIEKTKKSIEADSRSKDELADLEEVLLAFRDNLVARVAPVLAEATSTLLGAMTGGRYDTVELSDTYEMRVHDQGQAYDLKRYSGGESDIANLALRLAVSRTIAERAGASPVSLLVLDEIFGSLDKGRRESVMRALNALAGSFRQILLITHIEEVKELFGPIIRVEETADGFSTARIEQ
jgi:exonuclease SbcC